MRGIRRELKIKKMFLDDYKNKWYSLYKTFLIHRNGFLTSNWRIMDLDNKDHKEYLNDVDYFRMHPINGDYSKWIDDKLTLKYICSGSKLDRYFPKYYYIIDENGKLHCLMDNENMIENPSFEEILNQLYEYKELALKQIAGSIGEGFYKAEYKNGEIYLNGKEETTEDFITLISSLRNYIVMEYLNPNNYFFELSPNVPNTIRYLVGRIDGKLEFLKGYIRFGTKQSGAVENYNCGGILCYLDQDGYYKEGNVLDELTGKNKRITKHPDNGVQLSGRVPLWEEIIKAVHELDLYFPTLCYMGIDFVVTSKNDVKILEINSLTSLDGIQLTEPIKNTKLETFYSGLGYRRK